MKSMKTRRVQLSSLIALSTIAITAGCAQDRSLDDYRREKAGQELTRLQSADGLYLGEITLNQDNSVGKMSIRLKATTVNKDSSDGLSSEQKAALWGEVRYYDPTLAGEAVMSFDNGFYSDVDNTFRASIPLNASAAGAPDGVKLDLFGSLKDGILSGRIEVSGVTQNGGKFKLTKQDAASDSQSLITTPVGQEETTTRLYSGTSVTDNSLFNNLKVNFKVTAIDLTNEATFYTRLQSVRYVNLSTNFGGAIYASGQNAIWDLRTHSLRAKLPISGGSQNALLDVDCVESGTGAQAGWKCSYAGVNGYLFDVALKPVKKEDGIRTQ